MGWTETCVMEQRVSFVMEAMDGTYNIRELCCHYGISRKTAYKWLGRYRQGGVAALDDRSRAPHSHPQEVSHQVKQAILAAKVRYPDWGAPKIRERLQREHPDWDHYPAVSTIGLFLSKNDLTRPRRRRRRATPSPSPLTSGNYINQVWCADFKGFFPTGDGRRCNPLTISDHASRYLLCCRHVDRMGMEDAKKCFEKAFRKYGLPEVIRTDNGAPFASVGLGGLSRLSYWWIRLGIIPERIEPGHPEQNGRHERMHKTLKERTARPAAASLVAQQRRFNEFVVEYNDIRPHEALQMRTPSEVYSVSPRRYPSRLPQVSYRCGMQVKRVHPNGEIKLKGRRIFVTQSLSGELVGVEQLAEDKSLLWYCDYPLGIVDHREWKILATGISCPASWADCERKPRKVLPMSSE